MRTQPEAGRTEAVMAGLVVDASPRSSRAPGWLEALGYPPPEEARINAYLAYATREYAFPSGFLADWQALIINAHPPLIAGGGTLVRPFLAQVLEEAEPLSPIRGLPPHRQLPPALRATAAVARATGCSRRRGLRLQTRLCPGDERGGQVASTLDACLSEQRRRRPDGDLAGLARRFHSRSAKDVSPLWTMATGQDLRYPTTEVRTEAGAPRARPGPWPHSAPHPALHGPVTVAATRDPRVGQTFLEVVGLLSPPAALFRPKVALAAPRFQSAGALDPLDPIPRPGLVGQSLWNAAPSGLTGPVAGAGIGDDGPGRSLLAPRAG